MHNIDKKTVLYLIFPLVMVLLRVEVIVRVLLMPMIGSCNIHAPQPARSVIRNFPPYLPVKDRLIDFFTVFPDFIQSAQGLFYRVTNFPAMDFSIKKNLIPLTLTMPPRYLSL